MIYDVFNGDADGLCALQQYRLKFPVESQRVSGVKRDIALLKQLSCEAGDEVNVFDISLDKNRQALLDILAAGAGVHYFDHHFAGELPSHEHLDLHIDTRADTCTSLIVDQFIGGEFSAWAAVGAFGDNFDDSARQVLAPLSLTAAAVLQLQELGNYLNYNGYGATLADLHFSPLALSAKMQPYADPLVFIHEQADVFETLKQGSQDDFSRARQCPPELLNERSAVYLFPAEPWARRVAGVYGNQLASEHPGRAHALLTELPEGGYVVSVRAPLNNKTGADELCRAFPTGGGRKAAAGINQLPVDQLTAFIDAFRARYEA